MPTKERDAGERERCVTGIDAIDHILNGGIPRGNTVLISGSVGTGKTSMCIEFLIRGALEGENSLYLSVTEPTDKLLRSEERRVGKECRARLGRGRCRKKDVGQSRVV